MKKVFLKISQYSQENTCAGVSFLIKTLLKKRLWRRCFPVTLAKFLKAPFLREHLRWLLVKFWKYSLNLYENEWWIKQKRKSQKLLRQNSCDLHLICTPWAVHTCAYAATAVHKQWQSPPISQPQVSK